MWIRTCWRFSRGECFMRATETTNKMKMEHFPHTKKQKIKGMLNIMKNREGESSLFNRCNYGAQEKTTSEIQKAINGSDMKNRSNEEGR